MIRLLPLLLVLFLLGCSSGTSVAGGSDNPDFLMGVVVASDNTPQRDVEVQLIPSDYSPLDPGDVEIKNVRTNDDGSFRFDNIANGDYSVQVIDTVLNIGAVETNVSTDKNSSLTVTLDSLGALAVLYDDSLDTDSGIVALKGTSILRTASEAVSYENSRRKLTFRKLPYGSFDNVEIVLGESTFVQKDISIAPADTVSVFSESEDPSELRPLWEFPIIAGVPETMVSHFGTIEAVRILIENQLEETENRFNDPRLNGAYSFPLDSLYVITGKITDDVITPPDGFAYRLLYSPFEKSSVGNVNITQRVIIHDHQEKDGGTFGDVSNLGVAWAMGLVRGAYYVAKEEVFEVNNPISSEGFTPEHTIMFLRGNHWLDYSIELLNRSGASMPSDIGSFQNESVSSIELTITDSGATPLIGARVTLYGVVPYSLTVTETALATLITDANGKVRYSANYLNDAGSDLQYSNILLQIDSGNSVSYEWLPYSEVSTHFLQTGQTIYYKTIKQ